jgi:hypothetical protein
MNVGESCYRAGNRTERVSLHCGKGLFSETRQYLNGRLIMLKDQAEDNHDQMVEHVARHLKKRFYRDIRAKVGGFPPPERITNGSPELGQAPDVTVAAHGDNHHLFEIETPDSIPRATTRDKWFLFAQNAVKHNVDFWIVVPKGTRKHAERKLRNLNLKARVWEV